VQPSLPTGVACTAAETAFGFTLGWSTSFPVIDTSAMLARYLAHVGAGPYVDAVLFSDGVTNDQFYGSGWGQSFKTSPFPYCNPLTPPNTWILIVLGGTNPGTGATGYAAIPNKCMCGSGGINGNSTGTGLSSTGGLF
jgi:hypothetical protein